MKSVIKVFFSFRSPYCYLVTPDVLKLKNDYDVDIKICPVLPIAIRAKNIVFDDPKGKMKAHYILLDSFRRAQFLNMKIDWPKPDPVVQNLESFEVSEHQPYIYRLNALCIEAEKKGKGVEFILSVSRLIFGGVHNWDEGDKLQKAVLAAGLKLEDLETLVEANGGEHAYMKYVNDNHQQLDAAGHWGVPTMVFNEEPFFGQDRIETLRWRLDQANLRTN